MPTDKCGECWNYASGDWMETISGDNNSSICNRFICWSCQPEVRQRVKMYEYKLTETNLWKAEQRIENALKILNKYAHLPEMVNEIIQALTIDEPDQPDYDNQESTSNNIDESD